MGLRRWSLDGFNFIRFDGVLLWFVDVFLVWNKSLYSVISTDLIEKGWDNVISY